MRIVFVAVLRTQNDLSTKHVLVFILMSDEGRIPSASDMLLEKVACVGIGWSPKPIVEQRVNFLS